MIQEILRQLATHLTTRLIEKRLKTEAMSPGSKGEGQEVWRLRYSALYRVVWACLTVLWATATGIFVWLWWQARSEWRMFLPVPLFAGAAVFSALAARDALMQEIDVSAWGLTELRRGEVVATFPWTDVIRVVFVSYLDSYRVLPRQAKPVRISMHIQGIPRFKFLVRRFVSAEALQDVRGRIADLSRT